MAHTKAGGSTKLGRDSRAKRLGVKINHGQAAAAGQIIIRQRGLAIVPGKNVGRGADDTLYALVSGTVQFKPIKKKLFNNSFRYTRQVNVI